MEIDGLGLWKQRRNTWNIIVGVRGASEDNCDIVEGDLVH